MARRPKLRKKEGFWFSEAGGQARRYGKVGEVSHEEAMRRFHEAMAATAGATNPALNPAPPDITVLDLIGEFLKWVLEKRGALAHDQRERHLFRWLDHVGVRRVVVKVTQGDMEGFLRGLAAKGYAPDYQKKHFVSVNAMFNWGVKHGKLPPTCKPFVAVEKVRVPLEPLNEHDLPTKEEVRRLFQFADADLDPVWRPGKGSRPRTREERRVGEANPYRGIEEMLRVYHGTGARTYELCDLLVGDFQPRARQLILGKHKTVRTQKKSSVRQIALTDAAFEILERLCHGRQREEAVFLRTNVRAPWDAKAVERRFARVRRLAKVRDSIIPYSYRHLWISQLLQAGVDVFRVAKMAGNSVEVIETTYGHLRSEDFQAAMRRLEAFREV